MAVVMKYINLISRCAELYRAEKLGTLGLAPHHHTYVVHISREPGVSQEELCRRMHLNKSSVARALLKLERDGFCERVPDENDRRVLRVYPTKRMTDVYPSVVEVLREWKGFLLGDLCEEEVEMLSSLLARISVPAAQYADEHIELEGAESEDCI